MRGAGPLDLAGFAAVTRLFGPIKMPRAETRDGRTRDYAPAFQVIDAGRVVEPETAGASSGAVASESLGGLDPRRPGLFETFHIDDCYVARPAAATVVHARALPSRGGNTEFLDLRVAHAQLSEELRAALAGLRAVHAHNNEGAFPTRVSARGANDCLAPASHPLVRTHPVTGRLGLYFDLDRATHVEGMSVPEGRALLERLQDQAEASAPRHQHVWQTHDVLVWDNVSLQHRARGDFPVGEPRQLWRHLVEGDRPV